MAGAGNGTVMRARDRAGSWFSTDRVNPVYCARVEGRTGRIPSFPRPFVGVLGREKAMASRYFPMSEYEDRWKKVQDMMKRRGHEVALIWGKTSGVYERAGDMIYLSNFFSTHSGQEPDTVLWNARGFSCIIMQHGKEPELHHRRGRNTDRHRCHQATAREPTMSSRRSPVRSISSASKARSPSSAPTSCR